MTTTAFNTTSGNGQGWSGVFAMSLGAFALVASEFMPVSLLTPIASDLHSTEGQAGQAIAISGAFALVTSLFISSLAGKLDRKILLLLLTLLVIISGTIVAIAHNYGIFMVGRSLIGIAIGGFWSMSAATAMRLVSEDKIPKALAIVNGGNALATVIAAPLGSYLGGIIGWRGAFFCVVPVAVITFCWLLISLPAMKPVNRSSSGNALKLMMMPQVAIGMVAVSIFFMGQFALFTYLRPFLENVTHAGVNMLSLLLLVMGVSGFFGTLLIGVFLKDWLYKTLMLIPLIMAIIAIALTIFGYSVLITALLLGVWGLVGTAAPVAWWTWLAKTLPNDAEAGGGLFVAIIQLAITAGAMFGGILFDLSGYRATFWMSASLLITATILAYWTSRIELRHSAIM
jgi:predicted MFS family arabinose efflux permease